MMGEREKPHQTTAPYSRYDERTRQRKQQHGEMAFICDAMLW